MKDPANYYLCEGIKVADYYEYRNSHDREKIAILIERRFTERYLEPVSSDKENGFTIMAICCLVVETLESFYQGWEDTHKKSKRAFCKFFEREQTFSLFSPWSNGFYRYIRCGILHQAETKDGWRISRKGILLDMPNRLINANRFLKALKESLKAYCKKLKESDWNSKLWKNAIQKLDAICKNCETKLTSNNS